MAAGRGRDEGVLKVVTLAGLPPRLKHFRDSNLDAKDHRGAPITIGELRARLENQLRAETVLDAPSGATMAAMEPKDHQPQRNFQRWNKRARFEVILSDSKPQS